MNIGDVRFQIEWHTVKSSAADKDDIDMDADLVSNVEFRFTLLKAKERADQVKGESFFGVAQIQKQVAGIDTCSGRPDWLDVGEMIEMS